MKSTSPPLSVEQQLREMNEALLVSSIRQHELTEQAEKANAALRDIADRLRQSNAYTESIVATMREPMVVLDKDLRVLTASRSFYETFRVMPEDTENRPLYELGNGQWDIPDLRRLLEEILPRDNEVNDVTIVHDFEHIGQRAMLLNARRLIQAADQGPLILLAIEDVTIRSTADEALRHSEERYRALFASAPMAVFVCDRNAVIQQFNARAEELWGRTPICGVEKHCGSTKLWLPDGTLLPHPQSPVVDVLRTGIPAHNVEVFLERPDGSRLPVLVNFSAFKDAQGEIIGAVTSFIDISERKQAEEALRESEERFRNLADNIPQLAWIADANTDGQVHWFNQNWFDFTGTTLDEMKGQGWHAVHHPDHADRVIQKFAHHVRNGLDWEDTFPLRGKDGNFRWFLSRMKVIRDESGAVVRIFGTNTDVTDQRQMADELRRNAADMSEADHHKDEFLAMLAHELRNPLAPIRNALQIMKRDEERGASDEHKGSGLTGAAALSDLATYHSQLEMLERQVGQMVRLVDDLLDVSRISRGKIELRRQRIELQSVINHAVEAIRPQCERMNHELTVTLPSNPVFLNADPTRLAQVLGNLLNNACKFTDEGGRIWLSVDREDEAPAEPSANPLAPGSAGASPSQYVVIRVRDSGVGIAADELPRVFDMFTQVDTSLERSVTGLGIGLTLVKNMVELHGGTVEVHSAGIGQGSEFTVRLPILAEMPVAPPELTTREPSSLAACRILVVDDNHDSAVSLAMLLKLAGHQTHTAFDGLAAVEAAAALMPDVVLLDIGLPKLNGYEAARKIREQPWGQGMVLVALTGWGQDEDRRKSHEAGFNGHLVKPVDHAELNKMLSELLPGGD